MFMWVPSPLLPIVNIYSDTSTQSFFDFGDAYVIANAGGGRSGLDSNTMLASIHTFDPTVGCDPVTF